MLSLDAASWASFTQRLTTSKLHFSRCCGQQGTLKGRQAGDSANTTLGPSSQFSPHSSLKVQALFIVLVLRQRTSTDGSHHHSPCPGRFLARPKLQQCVTARNGSKPSNWPLLNEPRVPQRSSPRWLGLSDMGIQKHLFPTIK